MVTRRWARASVGGVVWGGVGAWELEVKSSSEGGEVRNP
jgi:hypothetical protein